MGSTLLLPGTPIETPTDTTTPGPGTHIQDGQIVASVLGHSSLSSTKKKSVMSVNRLNSTSTTSSATLLPSVGAVVYAKVTNIQTLQALCTINVICPPSTAALPSLQTPATNGTTTPANMHALDTPFRGILRGMDVRATEKDKVKLGECFRVGDIIRAVVISLGDQGGYYLSTAGNEYGVVMAWAEETGNVCVPVSWKEVIDEATGKRETRKVAKPI